MRYHGKTNFFQINREFRTPLPLKGSLKNIHPIAESTPVFAVPKPVKELKIPPAKSASVTKVKVSKKLSVPEVKPATTVKHAESQLQGDIVEIKKPTESVSHQPLTASKVSILNSYCVCDLLIWTTFEVISLIKKLLKTCSLYYPL